MNNQDRVDGLIGELNRLRLAWMWDDELPDNYSTKEFWPFWLRNHDGRKPVILRGSREWRDMTRESRLAAADDFVRRAARMFRVTADPDDQRHNETLNRIGRHCRKRWPNGRAWERLIYPQYERWENGELVDREENALERLSTRELYERYNVVRDISRMIRQLKAST